MSRNSIEGFTTEEHDWAWNTKGVSLYCVHCCRLQQRAPIDWIGIPLRVVEPPVHGTRKTSGLHMVDLQGAALLPDEAFTRVGKPVPDWLKKGSETGTV